ncbi:MAG: site-2 protease family protein [Planctomycetota bacterium]
MAILIGFWLIQGTSDYGITGLWMTAVTILILLFSILFHEYSHCWMAVRRGGTATEIDLWPLGGLAHVTHSGDPRDEIKVAGIGPLSSFLLCGVFLGALLLAGASFQWSHLDIFGDWWPRNLSILQLFLLHGTKLNLILGLFNLLVFAYPLDGGRMLFAFLTIRHGRQRAAIIASIMSIIIGIFIAIWGFAMKNFFVGLIGVYVLFHGFQLRQMLRHGALEGHPSFGSTSEFSYTPEPQKKPGVFARWRRKRHQKHLEEEARRAAELEKKVDAILEKVSREGIQSLTPAERKLLDRASRRSRGE